jgi:hypothetical protein
MECCAGEEAMRMISWSERQMMWVQKRRGKRKKAWALVLEAGKVGTGIPEKHYH